MTPTTQQTKIDDARRAKAEALAAWLTRNKFTAEVAAAMTPAMWADVARLCKMNPPSQVTVDLVLGTMQRAECAAAATLFNGESR